MKSVRHSILLRSLRDFYSHNTGFTLIEILVTLTILAAFAAGMMLALNPKEQLEKAENAARINNLKELKNAIQIYYEDNKCYPTQNSSLTQTLVSGGVWEENGVIYMQEVNSEGVEGSVIYMTDSTSDCPQWNVTFSKLASVPKTQTCPLVDFPGVCTPSDYDDDADHPYACVLSGAVNCSFIEQELTLAEAYEAGTNPITDPTPTPQGGAGGGDVAIPTPTPTFTPHVAPEEAIGWIDGNNVTDAIDIKSGNVYPYPYTNNFITYSPPTIGSLQYLDVLVESPISPVASVDVLVVNDTTNMTSQATQDATANVKHLSLVSGTTSSGTWSGLWNVDYTLSLRYKLIVIATDGNGNVSRVELPYYGYYQPGN